MYLQHKSPVCKTWPLLTKPSAHLAETSTTQALLFLTWMYVFYSFFVESASGPVTTPVSVLPKPLTSRQQVALELLQTEKNYVEILTNILKVNKLDPVPMNYLCD